MVEMMPAGMQIPCISDNPVAEKAVIKVIKGAIRMVKSNLYERALLAACVRPRNISRKKKKKDRTCRLGGVRALGSLSFGSSTQGFD